MKERGGSSSHTETQSHAHAVLARVTPSVVRTRAQPDERERMVRFNWDRLPHLLIPLVVAVLIYNFLRVEFGLSRLTSLPAGLFVARQVQARFLEAD